jgi:hypothetical protein
MICGVFSIEPPVSEKGNAEGGFISESQFSNTSEKAFPMSESILEELESIDKQASDMATAVVQCPELRSRFADNAKLLKGRLLKIAEELKKTSATYEERADQISETLLDLDFVEADIGILGLRFAQFIKAEKLRNKKT